MRPSTRRIVSVVVGLTLGTGVAGAAAGSTPAGGRPKGRIDHPCTLLDASKVAKAFGDPVADPVLDATYLACKYAVGDDPTQAPGGVVSAVQLFPRFAQALPTAPKAFQDQHAVDVLSDFELADVSGLGRAAYMNLTTGALVVLANKKFEFIVAWQPGSVTTPVTKRDQKKLVSLAKQMVARSPR